MKVKFTLTDETVVTSDTVKVIVNISGQVGEENRARHEERAREITKNFLDEAEWAYSNFRYGINDLTFSVQATCRIPAEQNQELHERAKRVSNRQTTLSIAHLDLSVPPRDLTAGESKLRKRMLERAKQAASELGDFEVIELEFNSSYGGGKAMSTSNATYAVSDNIGGGLGHSEKIALQCEVTVASTGEPSKGVIPLNG